MTAAWLAVLLTAVPFAVGALIARAVPRSWPARGRAALGLAVLVGSTLLGFLVAVGAWVTVWDGAWAGAAAGLGWVLARTPRAALSLLGVAAAVGLGEAAARSGRPVMPVPDDTRLSIPAVDLARLEHGTLSPDLTRSLISCTLAFPRELPGPAQQRLPPPDDRRDVVLVLGDSMSAGLAPTRDGTWPDLLRQRNNARFVASSALVGGSIDLHWAVLRSWRRMLGPRLRQVVLQVFINDPMELSRPWDCCDNRALIEFDPEVSTARLACDRPRWQSGSLGSWRWRAQVSPLPMAVRAAAPWSTLARRLVNSHFLWQTAIPTPADDGRGGIQRFTAALRGFAQEARGLDVTVVVIPWRPALDRSSPNHDEAIRAQGNLLRAARATRLRVLDPTDELRARARELGEAALFLPNGEHHFSPTGHEVIADWIAREVPSLVGSAPAPSEPPTLSPQR